MKRIFTALGIAAFLLVSPVALVAQSDKESYRSWIEQMKEADRGPFQRLRWFCNDGSVLPPEPYACRDHGGGHQHGQWSERTQILRDDGYFIANLLAGLDGNAWLAGPDAAERYAQIVVERFLIGADDGWIFRRALFYRGAIQEEDERAGARSLLLAMAADPYWSGPGYAAWRVGAKLLPHGQDNASIDRVRQMSAGLSDNDPGFRQLRAKIHGAPDAGDAARVREYASTNVASDKVAAYNQLADEIDAVYAGSSLDHVLQTFLASNPPAPLANEVRAAIAALPAEAPLARLELAGAALAGIFEALPAIDDPSWKLAALDLGISLENAFFTAATEFRTGAASASRAELVAALIAAADAAYGVGLFNPRLHRELSGTLSSLSENSVPLDRYREHLGYLGRAPGWATQALRMHFFSAMQKMSDLEPIAMRFVQDQLRGSALLLYADALDILSTDAGSLAGVRHRFFARDGGAAFTALNPGLARGTLHVAPDLDDLEYFRPDGIYVLPETVSDLPPVRGILTDDGAGVCEACDVRGRLKVLFVPNFNVCRGERIYPAADISEQISMAGKKAGSSLTRLSSRSVSKLSSARSTNHS